jgi:hypothetical protein
MPVGEKRDGLYVNLFSVGLGRPGFAQGYAGQAVPSRITQNGRAGPPCPADFIFPRRGLSSQGPSIS